MKRLTFLLLAAVVGMGWAARSGAGTVEIQCNIDIYNLSGHTANDFDILLNQPASQVTGVYQGSHNPFPTVTVTDEAYGSLIRYSGAEVAHGGAVHVGYGISPSGPTGTIDQYWSWNGTKLGAPIALCGTPANYLDGRYTNTGNFDMWVSRRVLYQSQAVSLPELMVNSVIWNNATLLENMPTLLRPGETLNHFFTDMGHGAYVSVADVCLDAACAQRLATSFTAVNYTPEPGGLALMALGLPLLWLPSRTEA